MLLAGHTSEGLHAAALHYIERRYSVLPLIGGDDPDIAKRPPVEWRTYQNRRPTCEEIDYWFLEKGYRGLGIITGAVSCVAVLDIDAMRFYDQMQAFYPDLMKTLHVATRRGVHLYYQTFKRDIRPNRKFPGLEFRYEGQYVVAPPTVIGGHGYATVGHEQPLLLTELNWIALRAFLDEVEREVKKPSPPRSLSRSQPLPQGEGSKNSECLPLYKERVGAVQANAKDSVPTDDRQMDSWGMSADALRQLYAKLAREEGRNNGLFKACCIARDNGISRLWASYILLEPHVSRAPSGQHRPETPERRRREGVATIGSAYSRAPRKRQFETPQLDTSIREALCQRGLAFVVRVIEGLRLKGIQPGQPFTRQQAVDLLRGIVGRDATDRALKISLENRGIFERAPSLPEPLSPQNPANAAWLKPVHTASNAVVRGAKSGKNRRGRSQHTFIMPDNAALSEALGVERRGSDPLDEDDLRSNDALRRAIHRELPKRRAGQYSVAWLARRLGVTKKTLRRYNRQIPHLHSAPTFFSIPIGWFNLSQIPPEDMTGPEILLQDEFGKRYPAKVGIARKLLKRGYKLKLIRQQANYYWYGEATAPPLLDSTPAPTPIKTLVELAPAITPFSAHIKRFIKTLEEYWDAAAAAPPPASVVIDPLKPKLPPPSIRERIPSPPPPPPKWMTMGKVSQRKYWYALEHEANEWLAEKLYMTVNERTTERNQRLSKAMARRWVDTYGENLVRFALKRLETKQSVYKPSGFVATVLRSTAKYISECYAEDLKYYAAR